MSEPMFKLATTPRSQPHKFGAASLEKLGAREQHERTCPNCGLMRITVITARGDVRREYRWGSGPQFAMDREPVCQAITAAATKGTQ
jgi:hypothetical protein